MMPVLTVLLVLPVTIIFSLSWQAGCRGIAMLATSVGVPAGSSAVDSKETLSLVLDNRHIGLAIINSETSAFVCMRKYLVSHR